MGLGHVKDCPVLIEISELSDKRIEEFFEGKEHMFARSETNDIYSWGTNGHGLSGRGFRSFKSEGILKPKKIEFLSDKNIITIRCNDALCLALSSNDKIYGWGSNYNGQIGCGKTCVGSETN